MKRYNPECEEDMIPYMDEYKNGRYVKFSDHSAALSSLQAKHDRYEEALKRIRMMTGQGSPYNRIATEALADEVTDERAQNGNDHG